MNYFRIGVKPPPNPETIVYIIIIAAVNLPIKFQSGRIFSESTLGLTMHEVRQIYVTLTRKNRILDWQQQCKLLQVSYYILTYLN